MNEQVVQVAMLGPHGVGKSTVLGAWMFADNAMGIEHLCRLPFTGPFHKRLPNWFDNSKAEKERGGTLYCAMRSTGNVSILDTPGSLRYAGNMFSAVAM